MLKVNSEDNLEDIIQQSNLEDMYAPMNDLKMMELSRWLCETEKQELHYDANILYENSNNNENWHSRVLRVLLEFRDGNEYPILKSFIDLIKRRANYPHLEMPHHENIRCTNESDRIDLLINMESKGAIIIENKINWAADQDKQIERYVDLVRENPLLNKSNIYVIYLTADGTKAVEDYSLTENAKKWLIGTLPDESSHFLPLNYAYDLLPWLEKDVSPNIKVKNNILLSSVTLYVDYLRNRFMRNESEQSITTKLIRKMEQENIKFGNLEEAFKAQEQASKFAERVTIAKEQKMKEVAEQCITAKLRDYLKELDKQFKLETAEFHLGYFNIIITNKNWGKCRIHLGIWQYKNYGGLQYEDPKNNTLQPDVLKTLRERFNGWKGDDNEPVWKHFDNIFRSYYSLEAWQAIENGDFLKYIESFIKEIYDKVNGIEI